MEFFVEFATDISFRNLLEIEAQMNFFARRMNGHYRLDTDRAGKVWIADTGAKAPEGVEHEQNTL